MDEQVQSEVAGCFVLASRPSAVGRQETDGKPAQVHAWRADSQRSREDSELGLGCLVRRHSVLENRVWRVTRRGSEINLLAHLGRRQARHNPEGNLKASAALPCADRHRQHQRNDANEPSRAETSHRFHGGR